MIHPIDAVRLGLDGDHSCNPAHPWCGAPNQSSSARAQWEECWDDDNLDFSAPNLVASLPPCILNLTAREKLPNGNRARVVAAKASDIGGILSSDPTRVSEWSSRFGIPQSCLVVVHQESQDLMQEKFAIRACDPHFWKLFKLVARNVLLVGPGYSVYDDGTMCTVRQTLNLRRSLLEAAKANRAGLSAVPTFGWNKDRPQDLEFLAAWLRRQRGLVRTVAVNAQTGTHSTAIVTELGRGIVEIERLAGASYQWLVFGGQKRIESLCEFLPRARITQVSRRKDFQQPIIGRSGALRVQYRLDLA